MEIIVKCNKLFIQDLPAGGSFFSFYFFFQAKYQLSSECISPVCDFPYRYLHHQPCFPVLMLAGFVFNRGRGRDGSVFLDVCETPTPSGLWERITPKWQIGHFLLGRDSLRGLRVWGFCSWRVGLYSPLPSRARRHPLIPGPGGNNSSGKRRRRGLAQLADSHNPPHFRCTEEACQTGFWGARDSVTFSPTVRTSEDLRAAWQSPWARSRRGSEGSPPLPLSQPAATHPAPAPLFPAASFFFFSVPSSVEPRLRVEPGP